MESSSKLELVRKALAELGDGTAQQIADWIERRHGLRLDARFIPVIRASLKDLELLEKARQAARKLVEQAGADAGTGAFAAGRAEPAACAEAPASTDGPAKEDLR